MKILLTGGAGYIGSHTATELLRSGHRVVIVDNLSNSSIDSVRGIEQITGQKVIFYECDILDMSALSNIFRDQKIDAVMHFAGLKAVGESVASPLLYYRNNLISTLNLLKTMQDADCRNLIFSSSATVYGMPETLPVTEDSPLSALNPYGYTKLVQENMLRDIWAADNGWNITLLRYFNPVGADESGIIGENPRGIPNNLFPFIMRVAAGQLEQLGVFGDDYGTPDGTAIRDYIHVADLAKGHIKALERIGGLSIYNLGTGRGYSVLECIRMFEKVTGQKIPFAIKPRRAGDAPIIYANPSKAVTELDWRAEKDLSDMCRDSWNFQNKIIS
ncbi:MAG: UDP-glucose 4-epimerase GalE [Alphaproteobacteria bacterium]|nr:UDP-glucose 4-epimerase GalE [Alphaproteobacteria bacterium]